MKRRIEDRYLGNSGRFNRHALMPRRLWGLCKGAISKFWRIPLITSSVTRTEPVKVSPRARPGADSVDVGPVADDAVVLAQENRKNVLDGYRVIDDFPGNFDFVAVVPDVGEGCPAHANPVNHTARKGPLRFGFDELIFDR